MRQSQLPALPSFPDRQSQRKARLVPSVTDENIIPWFSPLLSTDISAWWLKQIKAWGYEWEIVKEFHVSRPVKRFVQFDAFSHVVQDSSYCWRVLIMTLCLGPKQAAGLQVPSSWSLLSHLLAGSRPERMGILITLASGDISKWHKLLSLFFFCSHNKLLLFLVNFLWCWAFYYHTSRSWNGAYMPFPFFNTWNAFGFYSV